MLRSTTKRGVIAAGATITCSLLYPPLALAADSLSIMGENFADMIVRGAGAILVVFLVILLRHVPGRNFAGLLVGFLAFCVGVFAVLTPGKAVGLASSINDTITKGIPSKSGYTPSGSSGGSSASGGAPSHSNTGP